MNDTETATLAVVVARLDDLRTDMTALRNEVRLQHQDVVGRGEWLQRNAYVDSKFDTQGAEISVLKQEAVSKRAPWWSVVALLLSGLAVAWSVFEPVLTR